MRKYQERVARELGFKLVGHRLQLFGVPMGSRRAPETALTTIRNDACACHRIDATHIAVQHERYVSLTMAESRCPRGADGNRIGNRHD